MNQKSQSFKLRIQKLSAYSLITFGLFLLAILIPSTFDTNQNDYAAMIGATIAFGILPLVSGVLLLNSVNKKIKKEIDDYNERVVLNIARKNNGILTATEFSEQTEFNLTDATKILDSFVIKGIAIADVSENGLIELSNVNESICIDFDQLQALEKYIHLHYDLDINIEGIEAISHLLQKIDSLQTELRILRNRLST